MGTWGTRTYASGRAGGKAGPCDGTPPRQARHGHRADFQRRRHFYREGSHTTGTKGYMRGDSRPAQVQVRPESLSDAHGVQPHTPSRFETGRLHQRAPLHRTQ